MSAHFVLMESLEHYVPFPRAYPCFHSQGPPVCALLSLWITLVVTASGFSSVLTKLSSSLGPYHSEACQTLNRQMCGPGTCLFLATAWRQDATSSGRPCVGWLPPCMELNPSCEAACVPLLSNFMKFRVSLQSSQEPSTGPYTEPHYFCKLYNLLFI